MYALWRADGDDSEREVSTRRHDVFNIFMRFWVVIVRNVVFCGFRNKKKPEPARRREIHVRSRWKPPRGASGSRATGPGPAACREDYHPLAARANFGELRGAWITRANDMRRCAEIPCSATRLQPREHHQTHQAGSPVHLARPVEQARPWIARGGEGGGWRRPSAAANSGSCLERFGGSAGAGQ